MRFLRRSLTGLFLMALTLGLLGWAVFTVQGAVTASLNAEPRTFPQRERVVSVNVVTVVPGTITPELTVFGELRSSRSLAVRAGTGGIVTAVSPSFVDGGVVAAGEVLLTIDPFEAQSAVSRVEADLSDAEAAVREATASLALARDELAAAQAQGALRDQALVRQRDLQARGIGTAPELEAAELAASAANQAVLARRQAIADAEARIASTGTALARQRIALAEAERALGETTIRAAFDGTLTDVTASEGARVTGNEQVAQLIDPAALEAAFRVSTGQYATLLSEGALEGAPLTVSLDAGGFAIETTGRITRESATVGQGQTGRLIFAALDPAPGLRAGDFVTVRITEPEIADVALVPATAVAADGTVLVVGEDERLTEATVEVLRRQGNDVIVRAAALAGAAIVAERTPLLGAGIKVRPFGAEERALAAAAPEAPEMLALDPERRARLIAFVEGNTRMPAEVRERLVAQLNEPEVRAATVARLEEGMEG